MSIICCFELKLCQSLYLYGIHPKISTLFQISLFWTEFGPKKVQILVKFGAKLPFWQYHQQSLSFWDETRSVCVFPWYKLENSEIHSHLVILVEIWAREGANLGQIWCKIAVLTIASPIRVILSWNALSTCISMVKLREVRDSFKLGVYCIKFWQKI